MGPLPPKNPPEIDAGVGLIDIPLVPSESSSLTFAGVMSISLLSVTASVRRLVASPVGADEQAATATVDATSAKAVKRVARIRCKDFIGVSIVERRCTWAAAVNPF